MKRLLVTGASGLLGINLALRESTRREVIGITHSHSLLGVPFPVHSVDLTITDMIGRLLDDIQPDAVIHCAAMANIDDCEKQPELAHLVNALVPGRIATDCRINKVRFVHLSTDAVFDGSRGDYQETDEPNPLSVYATTKLNGEKAVLDACPDAVVARVNFYGWSLTGKRSLAEFFFNNMSEGNPIKGFTDVQFCPLFVDHLAELLVKLADGDFNGIYHVVSPVSLSKYEFGCRIADIFNLDKRLIKPVSVMDGGLSAPRSPRLTLNTEKLEQTLKQDIPGVDEGILAFAEQKLAGYPQQLHQYLDHQ